MSIDPSMSDTPTRRFGPADGATGLRGSSRPGWEMAENSTLTHSQNLSFWDFLDIINPLQHLPLIGPIYRHVSGDEMNGTARVLGGTLYGGPIGLAKGVADAVVHQQTGDYLGGHLMTAMLGDGSVDADPAGESPALLALGPIAGQEVAGDQARPHGPAPHPGPGPSADLAAEAPATQSRATVMVQRDGTVVPLDGAPPMIAPGDGARTYQLAARVGPGFTGSPADRNNR